jgi:hypothetical protein
MADRAWGIPRPLRRPPGNPSSPGTFGARLRPGSFAFWRIERLLGVVRFRVELLLALRAAGTSIGLALARSSTTMPTCSIRWIVMRSIVATRRPSYSVSRLPIGWWDRAAHWSEETSDELLGSIGS